MRVLNSFGSRLRMKSLLNHWVEFRVLAVSYGGKNTLTALAEKEFLKLKGKLAVDLEWLNSILPLDQNDDICLKVEAVMSMIQDHHTLPHEDQDEPWNVDEFDKIWHDHFIFLNRLKGMELKRASESPRKLVASLPGAKAPNSGQTKRLVIAKSAPMFTGLLVIVFLLVLAKAMGLENSGNGFKLNPPQSFGEVLRNISGLGSDVWGQVQGFMEPIMITYGPLWTAILLAILLSAFGYLVFSHR
ncbi:hypothetical protein H8E52_07760 [bacterium]|nr:hypothetical protein [bacterium]